MRETKYRAWNYVEEKFYYGEDIPKLEARHLELRDFFAITRLGEHPNGFEEEQQYIGLKDKNKVEVYEGDIVIARGRRDKPSIVEYSDGSACFKLRIDKETAPPLFLANQLSDNALEVISNTYENKELLEEKK